MDVEERAKQMGWTPQEEFKGNPDNWVDAETFVEKAETQLPIAKGTIKKLEQRLAKMQEQFQEFAEYHKGTAEREYNRALNDLKKRQIEAVEEGDTQKFQEVQKELDQLVKEHPMAGGPGGGNDNQQSLIQQWIAENPWYSEDDDMADYAHRMDVRLRNLNPNMNPKEHLAKVTEKVKAKFPDKFGGNSNRDNPAMVEGGESLAQVRTGGKKSYGNLPAWAKEQCDRFVNQKLLTREQYVKDFTWE